MQRHLQLLLLTLICGVGSLQAASASPGQIHYVHVSSAELHAQPSFGSAVLHRLRKGDRLIEFQRRDAWIKLGLMGAVAVGGWLPSGSLVPSAPGTPATADSESRNDVPSVARPPTLLLEISGTPTLAFTLDCRLIDDKGVSHRVHRAGYLPKAYTFEAAAVTCRIKKSDAFGRLTVSLIDGNEVVARQSTRAAFNFVRLRSDGPWGPARGRRGSVGLLLARHGAKTTDTGLRRAPGGAPIDAQ